MTGKTKKFELLDIILELSHFSGTPESILSFLGSNLRLLPECRKLSIVTAEKAAQSSKEVSAWIRSTDKCIQLFNTSDIPKKVLKAFSSDPEHKFAVPVRKTLLGHECIAFIFIPLVNEEILKAIEILSVIAGQKIDLADISDKISNFMKFYNVGRISYEIFHEIKNKLIAPSTFIQAFPSKSNDEKFKKEFSVIAMNEIELIRKQVERVMQFGKTEKNEETSTIRMPLKHTAGYCLSLLEAELSKNRITVNMEIDEALLLPLENRELRDVLFNILLNAIQALKEKEGGTRTLCLASLTGNKGSQGFFIQDNGIGMDPSQRENLFKPFTTGKVSGNGLGLSIVKKIIENSGGVIEVESEIGKGAKFIFKFNRS